MDVDECEVVHFLALMHQREMSEDRLSGEYAASLKALGWKVCLAYRIQAGRLGVVQDHQPLTAP